MNEHQIWQKVEDAAARAAGWARERVNCTTLMVDLALMEDDRRTFQHELEAEFRAEGLTVQITEVEYWCTGTFSIAGVAAAIKDKLATAPAAT